MSASNRIPPSVVRGYCSTTKPSPLSVNKHTNRRCFRLPPANSGPSLTRTDSGPSVSSHTATSTDNSRINAIYKSLSSLFWHRRKVSPSRERVTPASERFRKIPIVPGQPVFEESSGIAATATDRSRLTNDTSEKKPSTFVVGLEGDSQGYLALHKAFELSNTHDKILGVHIPVENYERIYEVIPHLGDLTLAMPHESLDHYKKQFMDLMLNRARLISSDYANKEVHFEMIFGDDSLNVKEDLIEACREFGSDFLVIGHSMSAHNDDGFFDRVLGHISDYCVDKSPCTVVIVKDHNKEGDQLLKRLSHRVEMERQKQIELEKEQIIQEESDLSKQSSIPTDHP